MNKENEQFFGEGIFRYAETRATVDAYEQVARAKIEEIGRTRTAKLRGDKSTDLAPRKKPSGFQLGDEKGLVAWALVPGTVAGEKVVWEVGVWWQQPEDGNDVIVYAECNEGPDWLKKRVWAEPAETPSEGWDCYAGGLGLRMREGDSVENVFDRLLTEVAAQLKRSR